MKGKNGLKKIPAGAGRNFIPASGCLRCGGFMVDEPCFGFVARRCVQCGDLVDPVIVRNRQNRLSRSKSADRPGHQRKAA